MNSTSYMEVAIFIKNTSITTVESWFIPTDILMIICCMLTIILACLFLLIIILDKTCHTVPMLLIANSCLITVIAGCDLLGISVFSLQNDLQQIQYQDLFCVPRAYILNAMATTMYNSYVLQAFYRYIAVVYPARLFWQSTKFQLIIICFTWIFGVLHVIPYISYGDIRYDIDNQICELFVRVSFAVIYLTFFTYILPVSLIMFIYLKLVRHVYKMNNRILPVNTLSRAKKQLHMVQRILILIIILITISFPNAVLALMSFFNVAVKYHFRIGFICIDVSLLFVMIALFQFTESLQTSVNKIFKLRTNVVIATLP